MTIQNVELNTNEQAIARAVTHVARTAFVESDENPTLTKNQRATNRAIEVARAIAGSARFEVDPETALMSTMANLHMSAAEFLESGETSEHLSLYILGRRVMHQVTYAAINTKRDAQKAEQQRVRSNVGKPIPVRAGADDWARALTTTVDHATADELVKHNDGEDYEPTPAERDQNRVREAVAAADYVYDMLEDAMNSWATTLTIAENNLVAYLHSVGSMDYMPRDFVHSYTSVNINKEYTEAFSYEEAERLLEQKKHAYAADRKQTLLDAERTRNKILRTI